MASKTEKLLAERELNQIDFLESESTVIVIEYNSQNEELRINAVDLA